jgi:hypothetical protein
MKITWNDLAVYFEYIDKEILVEDWKWLVGNSMLPILVTSIGDMFLQDIDGSIHLLITGNAELTKIANTYGEFQESLKSDELIYAWFLTPLVIDIKKTGLKLEKGKLFSFKKMPILGGEYKADNFELIDIEIHFSLTGQINYKIKELSDGTKVNFDITD